jgi:DNA-binding transcriptional MerR regulator
MPGKQPFISDLELQKLAPFFVKDYSQEAMSFLSNYHRILNYWGDGVDILPPQQGEGKRRKFSFFDLVWLGIVRELREFGMEKEKIAVLKGELLSPPDHKEIRKQLRQYRKESEEILSKNYGVGTDQIIPILDEYLSKHMEVQKLSFSLLSIYIYYLLGRNSDVSILVGKDGHHQIYLPDFAYSEIKEGVKPSIGSHISISLNEVIHFFVTLPYVKDDVKQQLLSPKEWQLIELSRKPDLSYVKVSYNEDGNMKMVELTRKKKVSVEARLTEILLKGGYERIEIETQGGKPVSYRSTEKVKL